jgi:hypothetical protein
MYAKNKMERRRGKRKRRARWMYGMGEEVTVNIWLCCGNLVCGGEVGRVVSGRSGKREGGIISTL